MFKKLILVCLPLLLATSVHAKTTTFDWRGKVTEPAWRLAIGDMVRGTFEIDDEGAYEPEFSNDDQKVFYVINATMNAGGKTFKSLGGSNGHPSFDLNVSHYGLVSGNIMMSDDSPIRASGGGFSFFAQTRYGRLDLMAANNLDKTFLSGGFGMELLGPDVPYNAERDGTFAYLWGDIDSVTKREEDAAPVPEPSSMILFGSSLLAFAGVRLSNARNRHARKAP